MKRKISLICVIGSVAVAVLVPQRATAEQLSCAELTRRTRAALAASLPEGLSLRSLACSRPLTVPAGEVLVEAHLADGARPAGRVALSLELRVGDAPVRRLSLIGQIDGNRPVVVAVREIAPGVAIAAADLRVDSRPASGLPSDCLGELGEVEGRRSLVRLRAGSLLRRGSVAEVPLVNSGAAVTVSTELPGLRVTVHGTARQDGRRGETILVLCAGSTRLVKARVVGPHAVVVDL